MQTKSIIFQCPEELKTAASKKLADCGFNMSDFLRLCLQKFLDSGIQNVIDAQITAIVDEVKEQ